MCKVLVKMPIKRIIKRDPVLYIAKVTIPSSDKIQTRFTPCLELVLSAWFGKKLIPKVPVISVAPIYFNSRQVARIYVISRTSLFLTHMVGVTAVDTIWPRRSFGILF